MEAVAVKAKAPRATKELERLMASQQQLKMNDTSGKAGYDTTRRRNSRSPPGGNQAVAAVALGSSQRSPASADEGGEQEGKKAQIGIPRKRSPDVQNSGARVPEGKSMGVAGGQRAGADSATRGAKLQARDVNIMEAATVPGKAAGKQSLPFHSAAPRDSQAEKPASGEQGSGRGKRKADAAAAEDKPGGPRGQGRQEPTRAARSPEGGKGGAEPPQQRRRTVGPDARGEGDGSAAKRAVRPDTGAQRGVPREASRDPAAASRHSGEKPAKGQGREAGEAVVISKEEHKSLVDANKSLITAQVQYATLLMEHQKLQKEKLAGIEEMLAFHRAQSAKVKDASRKHAMALEEELARVKALLQESSAESMHRQIRALKEENTSLKLDAALLREHCVAGAYIHAQGQDATTQPAPAGNMADENRNTTHADASGRDPSAQQQAAGAYSSFGLSDEDGAKVLTMLLDLLGLSVRLFSDGGMESFIIAHKATDFNFVAGPVTSEFEAEGPSSDTPEYFYAARQMGTVAPSRLEEWMRGGLDDGQDEGELSCEYLDVPGKGTEKGQDGSSAAPANSLLKLLTTLETSAQG